MRTPLERTADLVKINSANPFQTVLAEGNTVGIGNEREINLYLEQALRELGFDVERHIVQPELVAGETIVPARWNVLAQRGNGSKALLLYGHSDTVEVKQGWDTDPFQPVERIVTGKRRLYGLGSNDMKAGLAVILSALNLPCRDGTSLKIAFLCDEEYWSFGAHALVRSHFLDDVKLAIAAEGAERPTPAGSQWIGAGRLGRAEFEITVEGVACHGADVFIKPEAINAVYEAGKLIRLLSQYAMTKQRSFKHGEISVVNAAYVNSVRGGEAILSVPDSATLIFDRTFLPDESVADELRSLNELISKAQKQTELDSRATFSVRLRNRPTPPCMPYFFPPDHSLVHKVGELIEQEGLQTGYEIGRSVADENRLAERGIPTLFIGPDGEDAHSPNEWVDIESIERVAGIYRRIISGLSL